MDTHQWSATSEQPFNCFLPQSVKVYPIHQLLPDCQPRRPSEWNPAMGAAAGRHLADVGEAPQLERQLYIHIPFCPAFCHFCALYKTMDPKQQSANVIESFVAALIREVELYGEMDVARCRPITSIYFGGGTPTVLSPSQIGRILSAIDQHLSVADEPEVTLEGMPHHMKSLDYLIGVTDCGINRVSFGIQTFQRELRKQLGRIDTIADIWEAANSIDKSNGIKHFNVDLLMGLPGQTIEVFRDDLRKVVHMPADSVDILYYNAIPGTAYYKLIKSGRRGHQMAGKDLLDMRRAAMEYLASHQFHHVAGEVFSRSGPHLDNFTQTHYGGVTGLDEMVALGPSSYGFLNGHVYQNLPNLRSYLFAIDEGMLPLRSYQSISRKQAARRALLFGIQLGCVPRYLGRSAKYRRLLCRWSQFGLVEESDRGWLLTENGRLWYNMMQLEAIPLLEAAAAIDLVMEARDQAAFLFRGKDEANMQLYRELEKLIAGTNPLLRRIRRHLFQLKTFLRRKHRVLTFTGFEEVN